MEWQSFLIGLVIGWIAELIIDFLFWRRAKEDSITLEEHRAQLAGAQRRIEQLEESLATRDAEFLQVRGKADKLQADLAGQADCARQLAAAQQEITALKEQLAQTTSSAQAESTRLAGAVSVSVPSEPVEPDDLKKIEGIGPKIAGILNDAGILTFGQLAKTDTAVLQNILAQAGKRYQLADPSTWSEQAALAAAGKWDELAALQDSLKGGRHTSSSKGQNNLA